MCFSLLLPFNQSRVRNRLKTIYATYVYLITVWGTNMTFTLITKRIIKTCMHGFAWFCIIISTQYWIDYFMLLFLFATLRVTSNAIHPTSTTHQYKHWPPSMSSMYAKLDADRCLCRQCFNAETHKIFSHMQKRKYLMKRQY